MMIPEKYVPKLGLFDTERAIKLVKDTFETKLSERLRLLRVSAPKFLVTGTGLQDDLAGLQKPVSFKTKFTDADVEVVHSLAKWKRHSLARYGFQPGKGLYTDMDAIRKDEDISEIHSIYVDQWDWELAISKDQRTLDFLKDTVRKIYSALLETEKTIEISFPQLRRRLPKDIQFMHSEDLERMYPRLSPKEREYEIAKKYGAVFIIGIGHPLPSGKPHDSRASDYDDWSTETSVGKKGLNGDIIVWHPEREDCLELSSMGIRVDPSSLSLQLKMMGEDSKRELDFHKGVIEKRLPLSIGGGIGQSRLCMVLLHKAHIGEVQSSVWPEETIREFEQRKIPLL